MIAIHMILFCLLCLDFMEKGQTVYLSLGSNLGDKLGNLQDAIFAIQNTVGNIIKISPVYQSASWGFEASDFFNICLSLETKHNPQLLLQLLLDIETQLGRVRYEKEGYSSRPIDIDILYYGKEVYNTKHLVIPHPKLTARKFVLKPLADIAPQFYHPIYNKDTRNIFQECRDKGDLTKTKFRLFKNKSDFFANINFIAVEGNIGAGKTTLANKIAADFNGKLVLERFEDNPFLPKFYEDQHRYAFPLEMSFLADRYQQFTDDTSQYDLFKSFMVSDYDIYKSLIFAKITLQKEEFILYKKLFHLMYKEVKKPNIYVYLYQSPERLLENIKQRGRDFEQNISTTYLEEINAGYFNFIRSYPEQNNLIIDLGDLDFVKREEDYQTIINKIIKFAVHLPF